MTTTTLEGKIALITGAGRGIGRGIAERFGSLGAHVVVNYSTSEQPALETVAAIEKMGGHATAVQADISRVAEIDRLFQSTLDRFGRPDIVVANAGIEVVDQPVLEFSEADFDRVFGVNTRGTFFTLQRAARQVSDGGRIIYLGSSTTAYPTPGHGLYGGSKIAPQFLVEVLAKEIGHRGVTVNSILPTATLGAGVSTESLRPAAQEYIRTYIPLGRAATLDDVANAAEYLASTLGSFVSGQHLLLSGGGPA